MVWYTCCTILTHDPIPTWWWYCSEQVNVVQRACEWWQGVLHSGRDPSIDGNVSRCLSLLSPGTIRVVHRYLSRHDAELEKLVELQTGRGRLTEHYRLQHGNKEDSLRLSTARERQLFETSGIGRLELCILKHVLRRGLKIVYSLLRNSSAYQWGRTENILVSSGFVCVCVCVCVCACVCTYMYVCMCWLLSHREWNGEEQYLPRLSLMKFKQSS